MNLPDLLSQLEELSRQWRNGDFDYYCKDEAGREIGLNAAADELDLLIAKAKEPATDTVP